MERRFVTTRDDLEAHLNLTDEEKAFFEKGGDSLPLRVSVSWLKRMQDDKDPLRLQAVPRVFEFDRKEGELDDPIGDIKYSPVKGLIHHYGDRALILITDKCAMYCRHCFRRHFTGRGGALSEQEIDRILEYIREHREIHEIIISGGDSLMAPRERLAYLFAGLNHMDRPLVKRIGTRMPVVDPESVSEKTLDLLEKQSSLWMVLQINHIREMTRDFDTWAVSLRRRGIPLINQAVLLKGVNDSLDDQINLCYGLIERGIKPYYLFQGDLAQGTSHFRVPLDRALDLYGKLSAAVSHLALPRFGLDLPGGGGKVNLEEDAFVKKDEKYYYFRNGKGEIGRYPREME